MEQEGDWEDQSHSDEEEDQFQPQRIYGQQDQPIKEDDQADQFQKAGLPSTHQPGFVNSAYDMLHRLHLEWPCLSCDFVATRDPNSKINLQQVKKYPLEICAISGSQGTKTNHLYLLRCTKLSRTKYDDDSIERSSDQEDVGDDPVLYKDVIELRHPVNRLKTLNNSPIVSMWSSNGQVIIVNLMRRYDNLFQEKPKKTNEPIWKKVFQNQQQGFALDWNKKSIGNFATGSCGAELFVYSTKGLVDWTRSDKPYTYHKGSIEDIKFSPTQDYALMSCSTDRTVQFVDLRVGKFSKSQLKIKAGQSDVNVVDWNSKSPHLVVSGDDQGIFKIWDLRRANSPAINSQLIYFSFHKGPITTIQFQPDEESCLVVGSQDGKISLWDLAAQNQRHQQEYPNELMFLHQGHKQVKEVHFSPVYRDVLISTGQNGLHFFKPCLEMPEEEQNEDRMIIEQAEDEEN